MATKVKRNKISFKGKMVSIGVDMHKGSDRLTADGIECIVTPPSLIPTQSGSRVKTDKEDSLKLAKLFESNMLYPVTEPPFPNALLWQKASNFGKGSRVQHVL